MGCTTSINASTRRTSRQRARGVVRAAVVMGVAALAMLAPTELEASCMMMTSCQVYEFSSVIVQGTVTELTEVDLGAEIVGGRSYPRIETLVTIDVEKAWKGATPGTPIQIYTDRRGTSNGIEFMQGQKYLVFAYDRGGRLSTSVCMHTNVIDRAGEDLAFLETLSSPASGGRVYGRVTLDQRTVDMAGRSSPRAVSGRRVLLKGESGVKEAVTLEDGRYVFEGLSPGTYELDADLPKGWSRGGLPRSMTLKSMRSCEQADISTAIDGRLSGHVVGTDGQPLARVQVDAALLDGLRRPAASMASPASVMTDAQGRFELERLPPGRYIVGIHLTRAANDHAPYRFTAYPGATQNDTLSAITLDAAQQLDLGVLTVARVQSKRVVQGSVRWTDGRPVMSTRIVVTEIRPDWAGPEVRLPRTSRIEPDGRFAIELYEGVSYRIVAEAPMVRRPSPPPPADGTGAAAVPSMGRGTFSFGSAALIRSNAVDVTVTGELPIVTLVLDEAKSSPDARD